MNLNIGNTPVSPSEALEMLKEGNQRFQNNLTYRRDMLGRVNETKDGQSPFAAVLSCMDSRAPAEIIFDQGLGDIFSVRIAGNIVTPGILGSLEYATVVSGSKLIVVLGHTGCGAIKGACDGVQLGNLTALLGHIRPAIVQEKTVVTERNSGNVEFVNRVTKLNVRNSVADLIGGSPIIKDMVRRGTIAIVAAIYDVATGQVHFMDDAGSEALTEADASTLARSFSL